MLNATNLPLAYTGLFRDDRGMSHWLVRLAVVPRWYVPPSIIAIIFERLLPDPAFATNLSPLVFSKLKRHVSAHVSHGKQPDPTNLPALHS
jgi:hypothetical protein